MSQTDHQPSRPIPKPCGEIGREVVEKDSTVDDGLVLSNCDVGVRDIFLTPFNFLGPRRSGFHRPLGENVKLEFEFSKFIHDFESLPKSWKTAPKSRLLLNEVASARNMGRNIIPPFKHWLIWAPDQLHSMVHFSVIIGDSAIKVDEGDAIGNIPVNCVIHDPVYISDREM
jgi:hypothetical protein